MPDIVSVIYFIACAIYFFYGLLILSYNAKSAIHWLFFSCCLDLAIWALSFSIGNVAPNYESALFWRRIASIGWSSLFTYFLHYILILTDSKLLKKKWIYVVLYLPALMNLFLYSIYSNTAVESYHLVQTYFGWINVSGNTFLDWYYNVYYAAFSISGIVLLLWWGISSKEPAKRKQSVIIGISYAVAVILGTLTEYTINHFFHEKVPQLAPIIILIPLSAMLYCIRRYSFMRKAPRREEPETNQILSEHAKLRLYSYLSLTYIIAGFVNFGAQFFAKREQLESILLFSSVIFGLGLAVGLIQNLKIKQNYKKLFSNIAFVVSIPVIVLKYADVSGIYAWVVPVILLLVAIAFGQRQMLYFIGATTFATLIWLWVKAPVMYVVFSVADHISRLVILTIIVWYVFFINRTYVGIIKENKEKIRLEKLLNHLSNLFLTTTESNINDRISEALRLCGNHFDLECVRLTFLSEKMEPKSDYVWHASGRAFPGSCGVDKFRELIAAARPDKLAPEGRLFTANHKGETELRPIGAFLEGRGMKSMVIKPLREKNETIGILCQASNRRVLTWGDAQQQTINLFTRLIVDIWMKLAAERQLLYQANYDTLTGLPNRITFFNSLSQELSKAEQTGKLVGVIFVDIDKFKAVNDSLGHDSGDSLLVQIGSTLHNCIGPSDLLARFGGDEFLIMVPQMDTLDDVRGVAERLTDSFEESFIVKDQEFHMTASTGIAVYPVDGTDPETLIRNADLAMYQSKELGKNQYTFCSESLKEETLRKIQLTEDLHRALEQNELQLYYQPQLCTISKKIIGFEALLRWFHPEFGMLPPSVFVPLAEQTGQIGPIGDWALMTACLQCKTCHEKGFVDLRVAVNVSIIQLRHPGFVDRVQQILEETELEPQYLELEITESLAVNESLDIAGVLEKLNKLGILIAIDDFGTQYSSLSRLSSIPIDRIKLDMQFASNIDRSDKDNVLIRGIIGLAHSLGLKIIAEGVETEQQLNFLSENFVDEIQGFYFHQPMPAHELAQVLSQNTPS